MEIIKNKKLNGLEVKFDCKPNNDILCALSLNGFHWHRKKKIWYAKETQERFEFLQNLKDIKTDDVMNLDIKENIYGIKVGDIYYISWGYEQTNLDFFQVLKVTDKTVRIKQICPTIVKMESDGLCSRHIVIENIRDKEYPTLQSIFIKDSIQGDLKRLDKNGNFQVNKHYAMKYNGQELYESWYN